MPASNWNSPQGTSETMASSSQALISGRRLLVPVDLKPESLVALRSVCLRADSQAEIHALHVLQEPTSDAGFVRQAIQPAQTPHSVQRELESHLQSMGLDRVRVTVSEGYAPTEIRAAADRLGCDLIVMACDTKPWFTRLFSRRIAKRVLRKAPCPVLVLSRRAASESRNGAALDPTHAAC